MLDISPIGRVRSDFTRGYELRNQGYKADAEGMIELDPEYAAGATDLAVGDTVLVIWWAEDADRSPLKIEKAMGKSVFATRSPARPNPICITPCEITAVDGNEIQVIGIDMVDGTPVLDLKPPLDRVGDWDEYSDLREGYERSQEESYERSQE